MMSPFLVADVRVIPWPHVLTETCSSLLVAGVITHVLILQRIPCCPPTAFCPFHHLCHTVPARAPLVMYAYYTTYAYHGFLCGPVAGSREMNILVYSYVV